MKKRLLKLVKYLVVIVLLLFLLLFATKLVLDKPLPDGLENEKAEILAQKMLLAINDSAWQKIEAVKWNFDNRHQILWDKRRHLAKVEWGSFVAYMDCETQKGYIEKNGQQIVDVDETQELLAKAYFIWANDSYWLNPVSKIYDDGVTRKYVELEDGNGALLVTYSSGGVTPGDSYLWYVDENGLPYKWEMWVDIIPINGVETTWEGWKQSMYGPWYATLHKLGPVYTQILDVEMTIDLHIWYDGSDPFSELENML